MGRSPKSAAEKAVTGAGRRAKSPSADKASAAAKPIAFKPPAWLTRKDARDVWNRVVPELARINVMTEVFRDVVGRYCVTFADWVKVTKQIDRDGMTMMVKMTHSDERMPRKNPAVSVRDTLEKALLDIEDRFGISPIWRYKIFTQQNANPGQRDLFRGEDSKPSDDNAPLASPPRSSPIGALRPNQLN